MIFTINTTQAINWTTCIVAIYAILDTAGKLFFYSEFTKNGFWNWEFLREHSFFARKRKFIRIVLDCIFRLPNWMFLLALRFVCGAVLLSLPQSNINSICLAVLFSVGGLINLRNFPFRADSDGRMSLMVLGALLLRSIVPTPLVTEACLWFIALQSCLSYLTAGIVKLLNAEWRQGRALLRVFHSPQIMKMQNQVPVILANAGVSKVLAWFTIVIECAFPLVLIAGQPFFLLFLFWGIFFHLMNAIVFGYNKFFWAWLATYPALFFIAQ